MGGWASFNKYSLLGGLRSAAQIVSYEIPLTLSVVGLVILAGTISLNSIVQQQGASGWFTDWYAFRQPLGFLIFAIAATAEANRTPFDLTEADSEIVAGFATEYSGMRFGFLFCRVHRRLHHLGAHRPSSSSAAGTPRSRSRTSRWHIEPAELGFGLLFIVALVPLVGTLLLAAPFYLFRSKTRWWAA